MTRVVHTQKSAGIGGSERHLLALLPALARRGFEVSIVVLTAPGAERFTAALPARQMELVEVDAGPDLNPLLVWRLAKIFWERGAELVHTHLIHADVHGQIAAQLSRIPGVSSVHGAHSFYRRQPYAGAARIAARLATRTIAISDHVAGLLVDAGLAPSDRVRVVHYGIDASEWIADSSDRERVRSDLGVPASEVAVGIASRLIPGKGHEVLIRAVAQARRGGTPLRLLVAGAGPERPGIEATARSEGIADAVSFLGFVADVRSFMAACDVVAFPTVRELGEGFGLAALEAMAVGRPVVASRLASLPELVADNETGLLVESGDVHSLAGVLSRLAADSAERQRLGYAARRRAIERFSLDAMVDATVGIYEEVLAKPRRARC